MEKTTVRSSYLLIDPPPSPCQCLSASEHEGIRYYKGCAHPFPPILSFPPRLDLLLLFSEVFLSSRQKQQLFLSGKGRDDGNGQLSCCWSSSQILRSSPFHSFPP